MVYISLILIIAIFLYRFEKRVIQISFANFEEKELIMKRFLISFIIVGCCFGYLSAQKALGGKQTITVTGQVFDATDGRPIIDGASVRVKDSENGVVTDSEGRFTIDAALGDTLEVLLVGYGNTEVIVNDDVLNVFMAMNVWECPSATKGIVKDYNGKPICGATVTLSPSGESTVTNKKGKFKFDTESRDKMIIVECPGYETFRGSVSGNTFTIMLDKLKRY